MTLSTWLLLAALSCGVHSLSAPATMGDPSASHESASEEDSIPTPDKRILKYFLPSNQAWPGSSAENMPIPTGQEGSKRGYSDKNFLRFGRGFEADKRGDGRNFLRFGRGDSDEYDDELSEESSMSAEKRDRNFLRFGRNRNFLRFGRGSTEEHGYDRNPLAFGLGYAPEEDPIETEKRNRNYLRFGRGNKNFLRFGRIHKDNFIRFGRSVDSQTFCDDCEDDINSNPSMTSQAAAHEMETTKQISPKEHASIENFKLSTERNTDVHRSKRSASLMYYDYAVMPSHPPVPWAMNYQPATGAVEEEVDDPEMSDIQDVSKRDRNFLRFGRDRNFLRFGKREASDAYTASQAPGSNVVMVSPVQYPRFVRAPTNNFLRFG